METVVRRLGASVKISYRVHMDNALSKCDLNDKGECVLPAHWDSEEVYLPDACEKFLYQKMQSNRFSDADLPSWIAEWSMAEGVTIDRALADLVSDRILRRLKTRKLVAYDTKTRSLEWIGRHDDELFRGAGKK